MAYHHNFHLLFDLVHVFKKYKFEKIQLCKSANLKKKINSYKMQLRMNAQEYKTLTAICMHIAWLTVYTTVHV